MNPTTGNGGTEATRAQRESQAQLVASAVLNESCREVYKRRLLPGNKAALLRAAVRETVLQGLRRSHTHEEVAEAAALAVDRGLAVAGVTIQRGEADTDTLRAAHQEILDMGCSFGVAGDELAKAQRIASEALSGRYPDPSRSNSSGIQEER